MMLRTRWARKDSIIRRRPNFFPAKTFEYGLVLLNICDFNMRQRPFASPLKNFQLMFCWELIWKLTKSDMIAVGCVPCTAALNIPSRASLRRPEIGLPGNLAARSDGELHSSTLEPLMLPWRH